MGDDELIGLSKAAEETGLSREWLRKLYHRGELPGAQKVGNSIGIPRRQVDRLKRQPHKPRAGWPKGTPRKTISYPVQDCRLIAEGRTGYDAPADR